MTTAHSWAAHQVRTVPGRLPSAESRIHAELIAENDSHRGQMWSVAVRRGVVASAGLHGTVGVIDLATGATLPSAHPNEPFATSVALSDEHLIASGGTDSKVRLWDRKYDLHLSTLDHGSPVWTVAFGGGLLASAGSDGTIKLWRLDNAAHARTLHGHKAKVRSAVFNLTGTILASGSIDGELRVWDVETGRCLHNFAGHRGEVRSVAVSTFPDGREVIASAAADGKIRLWDLSTGDHLHTIDQSGLVFGVVFGTGSDGVLLLASASGDGTIRFWDPLEHRLLHTIQTPDDVAMSIAVDASSSGTMVTGHISGTVRMWKLSILEPQSHQALRVDLDRTVPTPDHPPITALAFHRDDDAVFPTGTRYSIALFTYEPGQLSVFRTLDDEKPPLLAIARADGSIVVWRTDLLLPVRTFFLPPPVAHSLVFDRFANGRLFLAGLFGESTSCVWDMETGEQTRLNEFVYSSPSGHSEVEGPVLAKADLEGRSSVFITQAPGSSLTLWDHVTGTRLHVVDLDAPPTAVTTAPTSDGFALIASFEDELRTWTVRPSTPSPRPTPLRLRSAATALVTLTTKGLNPPLGLLADLLAITGNDHPSDHRLTPLVDHDGIRFLRTLSWPPQARAGLAVLLLADLPDHDKPPTLPPSHLLAALLQELAITRASDPQPPPLNALRTAADHITEQLLTLLHVVGPDAVATDPLLPLRLRDNAYDVQPLTPLLSHLLADITRRRPHQADAEAGSTRLTAGTVGISRRGSVSNLLHTQLALPETLFAQRHADGNLLYRVHEGHSEPPADPVTIVLDTSPPTFGPIESVLRLVAHAITLAQWAAHREVFLIRLDTPDQILPLTTSADLVALWSSRSLEPPGLTEALDTAAKARHRTLVLTHHHLAREHHIASTTALRTLTTHLPGNPPLRGPASPFHVHLPPHPTSAELARAVTALLADTPTPSLGTTWIRPPKIGRPAPRRAEIPAVKEQQPAPNRPEVAERLLRERIVLIDSEITDELATRVSAQIFQLAGRDPNEDITLYLNSPGGSVDAGMAVYDTMRVLDTDFRVYAMGLASGFAAVLLAAGTPGKRFALPHARIMIGTPTSATYNGPVLDRTKADLARILADHTGHPVERILHDWDPPRWFTAQEAVDYGLADFVQARPQPPVEPAAEGYEIPRSVIAEIIDHARQDHPDIACGMVVGEVDTALHPRVVPIANQDRSPTTWMMEPLQLLRLYQEMERTGEEAVIIYRSYTATDAYPSGMDISLAEEGVLHAIVSTKDPANPVFRLFRIVDGEVTELAVRPV